MTKAPNSIKTSIDLIAIMNLLDKSVELNETFWPDRFRRFESVNISYAKRLTSVADKQDFSRVKICLDDEIIAQLKSDYKNWNFEDLLLAAFVVYLARIEVVQQVGIGFSDCHLKHTVAHYGDTLASYLPLSIEVDTQRTFTEFLGAFRPELDLIRRHFVCPRDLLTQPSKGDNLSSTVFSVMFDQVDSLQNYFPEYSSPLALVIESNTAESYLFYQTNAFEIEDIEAMAEQFMTLLKGIIESSKDSEKPQPLAYLPLLTQAERHQLLVAWNQADQSFGSDNTERCIHQLFAAQVEHTPDAVAVMFEDQSLTYRDLNSRANQLAHHLQTLGIQPDGLVGIFVERSLDMLVGLLGILKAGAAYVPLDPNYPPERLTYILDDADVTVLLTQSALLDRLPMTTANVLAMESLEADLAAYNPSNPTSTVCPQNLAYTIYTSGSTGKPKGVAIEHHSAVTLMTWATDVFTHEQLAGVLAATSICFDLSVFELFVPLSSGGTVILAPNALHLPTLPAADRVTLVNTVPSAMAELCRSQAIPAHVTTVNLAGEALPHALAQQIYQTGTVQQVYNLYGPSEDTTYSTFSLVEKGSSRAPTIGRGIDRTQTYILDQQGQLVPIGVVGELYLGGDGLARGYLNRPDLTAEKFVPNPFGHKPGSRLYRTGDLARYLLNGDIEYLGRIDHQVKVRGFRIELGEIEAVLNQHPSVQQGIVIVREDQPDDKRIVAYVVPAAKQAVSVAQLRDLLEAKLPDYMMPQAFVCLDALPLTPNGKIDRKALPSPKDEYQATTEVAAPRNPTEVALVQIWQQVLRQQPIGIDDSFLHLGGHSLLAMRVAALVEQELGQSLPIGQFFALQTIAEQADYLNQQGDQPDQPTLPPIQPAVRQTAIPLSFPQRQLWFFDQLHPTEPVYNETIVFHIPEAIDPVVLEQALNQLIDRHEILRTTFTTLADQPVQVVHEPQPFPIRRIDLSDHPEAERVTIAHQRATAELKERFDLQQGPLWRVTLIKLDETDWRFYFSAHHTIMDGISMYNIFLPELEALYRAQLADQPTTLPAPSRQYVDFAVWQNQVLTDAILSSQVDYWQQKLADLPTLQLPTDRPLTAKTSFRGARQCLSISQGLTEQLNRFSQQAGVTLFVTLATAINILLYRYTGQEDLVLGTIHGGRNRLEAQNIMGNFLNNLVLRTDVSGNPTVREMTSRVNAVISEAYQYVDVPFETLVNTLQPERTVWQTPFFQVALVIEPPLPTQEISWGLSQLDIHTGTAKFDLTFELDERPEGIIGRVEYSTDLFDEATITRMIGHLQVLLAGIVQNPNQSIADLSLLTEAEWQALTPRDNVTIYPQDIYLHQLVEAQVESTPDAAAVVFEDQQITYRELNARANQLAHYLQTQGVKPDTLVGLCAERSLEMVVGLLGILKAGGAYVPLDPSYPQERLAYMLADADMPVLLTQQRCLDRLPSQLAMSVVCLDTEGATLAQYSTHNPETPIQPEHLAYVIYTSGSTGRPKGVMNNHAGVCNRLLWMQDYYQITAADKVLQKTPFSFDVSVWEFFWPLLAGAQLVVAKPEGHKDTAYLIDLITTHGITTLHFVPPMLQVFLEDPAVGRCHSLKRVICSGEALPVEVQNRFFERLDSDLYNLYGPTEAAIDVSYWRCRLDAALQTVPIGRPVANTQLYILDPHLNPVPIGVVGELHIGGVQVARGYLNRPDLTEERFIANPFGPGRLYKTGDLVRYRPDGNIEYLGRIDHQVKVRGFRIELGEIEAVLNQHPAVQQSLVMVRQDGPGDKRLVAYVISVASEQASIADMRQFLSRQLPDYMVPSGFVTLEAFPLTPNGKVDRKALPTPDNRSNQGDVAFVTACTPTEQAIVALWRAILNLDRVSLHDNFFALGGHSLLAVQLITQLKQRFQVKLSLQALLDAPTPAELADYIDTILWSRSSQETADSLTASVDSDPFSSDVLDSDALEEIEL